MVILIALCNHCVRPNILPKFIRFSSVCRHYSNKVLFSSNTDDFIENLVLEEGIKQEANLTRYFENVSSENLVKEILSTDLDENIKSCDSKHQYDVHKLIYRIEKETDTNKIPNEKLIYLLVYFTKGGNVNGVKAVQSIVEKYNVVHFKAQAKYNHYLAEAFWLSGKLHTSINLFSDAYDNTIVRPKVKVMLPNLFPLLTAQYSIASLSKIIDDIEQFSAQKRDNLILACLWKELFLSTWFSDQEQASKLLIENKRILKHIQWMIPAMGKNLLRTHRVDDYHRLIQFSLGNGYQQMTEILVRLLFEYHYIHQNIERCTAVVKYSSNLKSCLTEDQQRRYVALLLKSKDAVCSKTIIKKPQDLKYKF